jgi:hypothetical protein
MMVAEDFDPGRLSAMAARLLAPDGFGLEQVMPPGTQIHTETVGDYHEKSLCVSRIAGLVEQIGAPRMYREPIEQCVDEMLMNALYDAPVDAQGQRIFSGISTRDRVALRSEQSVVVQYAWDGRRFAVAVRDAFGTLDRQTVLAYLHKCLHAAQPVDRKAGGAGLGLYLMVSSSTAVYFNVLPGIATEALCMFDLGAPRLELDQLVFRVQLDAAGRVPAGPARRLPAVRRLRGRLLTALIAALLVAIGIVVLSRGLGGDKKTERKVELQVIATVELDSEPTGAAIEIDGKPMGSTPATLTTLPPGQAVSIAFKRTGYRTATARLEVPAAGSRKRLVQPLEPSDDFVRVRFVSKPPGAEVIRTGQASTTDRTYTPAEVFVEVGKVQRFTLTMPRHVPLVIEPFTPARGAKGLEKGGALVEGATLRIEGPPDGRVTVSGAPHCKDAALPIDCTLAPGTYVAEYLGPRSIKITQTVTMVGRDEVVKFVNPP